MPEERCGEDVKGEKAVGLGQPEGDAGDEGDDAESDDKPGTFARRLAQRDERRAHGGHDGVGEHVAHKRALQEEVPGKRVEGGGHESSRDDGQAIVLVQVQHEQVHAQRVDDARDDRVECVDSHGHRAVDDGHGQGDDVVPGAGVEDGAGVERLGVVRRGEVDVHAHGRPVARIDEGAYGVQVRRVVVAVVERVEVAQARHEDEPAGGQAHGEVQAENEPGPIDAGVAVLLAPPPIEDEQKGDGEKQGR